MNEDESSLIGITVEEIDGIFEDAVVKLDYGHIVNVPEMRAAEAVALAAQRAIIKYVGSHPNAEDMSRHGYSLDGPMFDAVCSKLGVK
jgi:hypothetical protein